MTKFPQSLNSSYPKYRCFTLNNFKLLPQVQNLSAAQRNAIETVGHVLPFKTNHYVVEQLIDWSNVDDPLYILNFPQRGMLLEEHYAEMRNALRTGDKQIIKDTAYRIRWELNPHPAGQIEYNSAYLSDGTWLPGVQHKYDQTVLFFPSQGQTCHAFCTFCFRWPQFVNMDAGKFAMKRIDLLIQYIKEHREVTDLLITGGDPLIMKAGILDMYVSALLDANIDHLETIRFGTKSISYWPYRFLTDSDASDILGIFRKIIAHGKHTAVMAHFNHVREMQTPAARAAISRIRDTGAEIRAQSPILRHINDSVADWSDMWKEQIKQGCVPYFMFAARDTGAQHYFAVPLARGWKIFRDAMHQVSGIARTVRGYSMSALPGKIQVVGVGELRGEKVFVLRMLQARKNSWAHQPFFAAYDESAVWIDDLKPAMGEEKFFFEDELEELLVEKRILHESYNNPSSDIAIGYN